MPSQKLGDVELCILDNDDQYSRMINNKAEKIASLVKNNQELFDILSHFLLKFRNKSYFENRFENWKKSIAILYDETRGLENLVLKIENIYTSSKDDFEIKDLRGRIFELIMQQIYRNLYGNNSTSIFSYGCEVVIRGNSVKYIDECSYKNRKTVDIAGYSKFNSEFYELKVGPKYFDYSVISYLNLLYNESIREKISTNLKVGCMTMESKEKLIQNLQIQKVNNQELSYDNLVLFGRDEIKRKFFST